MTTYTIAAEENFDAALVSTINGGTQTDATTEQFYPGQTYYKAGRLIIYSLGYVPPSPPTTNTTGFTLWNGFNSIAPGGAMNQELFANRYVMTKSIDTLTVTRYNTYSAASTVPNGIGGSDGTWRRFVDMSSEVSNGMQLTDPSTGDLWHHTNFSDASPVLCGIYQFRASDSYAQTISPLSAPVVSTDHMQLLGMTTNWVYCLEFSNGASGTAYLLATPRVRTAAEVTADYILPYFWFSNPFDMTASGPQYYLAYTFSSDNKVYQFGTLASSRNYKLYRFDEPSAAIPNNAGTVGGGFTEITPWSGSTGPNTHIAGYTLQDSEESWNNVELYQLPATNELACISKYLPNDSTSGTQSDLFYDCTYVGSPEGSATFDYHHAFVTGFMDASWGTLSSSGNTVPSNALYAVIDNQRINSYLDTSSFAYTDDYTERWMAFVCRKVTPGGTFTVPAALDNTGFVNFMVKVLYKFVSGSPPQVVKVVDESGWDAQLLLNPDYSGSLTGNFVAQCIDNADVQTAQSAAEAWTSGIYDASSNAFWWGAASNSTFFVSTNFETRHNRGNNPGAPFLRLGFGAQGYTQGHVY